MSEYDLTHEISNYLDKHLILPLLEYISVKNVYDETSLLKMKLDVLMRTSMIDYAADTYKSIYDTEVPPEFAEKREQVLEKIREVEAKLEPVKTIFSPETMKEVAQCKNAKDLLASLEAKYSFKPEMLDDMFEGARVFYNIGNYNTASEYLKIIRQLAVLGSKRHLDACWGRLASEILVQNWNEAMEDLEKLKDAIDCQNDERSASQTYLVQLQQRTWMLHWSLFVFFNHPQGKEKLIEWFMQNPTHLNAIQTLAPHLIRYLTVCVITCSDKKKKNLIRELVSLIQQESYSYRDPVTEFVECLFVKFDFDGTQQKLRICETVLPNDFFLTGCYEEFIDNARLLMFESFCRIHHSVGISVLSEKLNMTVEEAEKWIVNLIRNARMDAKIDSQKGLIIMGIQKVSPYQQVIERTKTCGSSAHKLLERLRWERGIDTESL
ncbi:unnamed protein product [Calicophoron daubneyi]|uniref:Eukaryotic translation initiation factor 3 subunit E n=1 Tax=Calicophoron daubneyi TaxID=300641 RepID=A0AAV2TFG8_CALDB